MHSNTTAKTLGAAQAALISIVIGLLTLALVNLGTEFSPTFKVAVHGIGKAWMPGAEGIGPYSGKESCTLLAWLMTWPVLHKLLRKRELSHTMIVAVFIIGVATATLLLWPPVFTILAGH